MNTKSLPAKLEIRSGEININTEGFLIKPEIENEETDKKDEVDQLIKKLLEEYCDLFMLQKTDLGRKELLIKFKNFDRVIIEKMIYSIEYDTPITETHVLMFEPYKVRQAIFEIKSHPIHQLIKAKPYWNKRDILIACEGKYLNKSEYKEMLVSHPPELDTVYTYICYPDTFWEYIDGLIQMAISNGDLKKEEDVIIKNGKSFSDSADNTVNAALFRRIFANAKENFKGDFPFTIPECYYEDEGIPSDKSEWIILYKHWRPKFFYKIEAGIKKTELLKIIKKEADGSIKEGRCTYYKYTVDNQEIIVNEYELSCIVSMLIKRDNEKKEKIKQKFSKQKHKS